MKILIIKLGALGDVLRTTPLLTGLKKEYPSASVTWLVDKSHRDILEENPLINRLISFSNESLKNLQSESFDLAINLDKEDEALDSLMCVKAGQKRGFGRDAKGALCAVDARSDYAYRLGMDDELKFRQNKKSYQEISFEQVGLPFQGQEYIFSVNSKDELFVVDHLRALGIDLAKCPRPIIGLNTGSGTRFAGKRLPLETFLELIRQFKQRTQGTIFLLGGQEEQERNKKIQSLSDYPVVNTGSHSIRRFAALVKACDVAVSGDTTAMHIAIAVQTPVIAYFASTCAAEIELYGRGEKIVSTISCSPCYKKICPIDEQCMKDMEASAIVSQSLKFLEKNGPRFSRS